MSEPDNNSPKRKHLWPWFTAAAVLVFVVITVLCVANAAKRVEQQRDFAPLPSSAPTR